MTDTEVTQPLPTSRWYAADTAAVAQALGVDPNSGMTQSRAAELLARDGPNALPAEKPKPGWERFLDEYRSYMQLILVGAGAGRRRR